MERYCPPQPLYSRWRGNMVAFKCWMVKAFTQRTQNLSNYFLHYIYFSHSQQAPHFAWQICGIFFFNQAQFFQISEFELADLTNETSAFGNRWSGTENVHQHQHNISSQTHSLGGGVLNKSFSPKRDAVAALFQWSVKKHAEHYQNIWRVILFIFVICMFVPLSLLLFNFWLSC